MTSATPTRDGRPKQMRLVLGEKCRESWEIVRRDRPDLTPARAHRGFCQGRSELCSSTSGWGSASSPSRLIQIVAQAERRSPARCRGRGSAATCTWRGAVGSAPREELLPVRRRRLVRADLGRDDGLLERRRRSAPARRRGSRGRCSRASRAVQPRGARLLERRRHLRERLARPAASARARPARRRERRAARARRPSRRDSCGSGPRAGSAARARGSRAAARRVRARRRRAARARAPMPPFQSISVP